MTYRYLLLISAVTLMTSCDRSSQSTLHIPFNEKEIKVDGVIEEAWKQTVLVENLVAPWNKSESDSTKFRAFVSSNYFNFCFQVRDNTITTIPFEKELSVTKEDRVELFFSSDTTLAIYYCFEIDPNGNVLDYSAKYYRDFDESWNFKSLEAAASISDTGYIVEGKISLKELRELGISNPFNLGIFRADFKSSKSGDVTWYSWIEPSSTKPDFHIPSAFGEIHLE